MAVPKMVAEESKVPPISTLGHSKEVSSRSIQSHLKVTLKLLQGHFKNNWKSPAVVAIILLLYLSCRKNQTFYHSIVLFLVLGIAFSE